MKRLLPVILSFLLISMTVMTGCSDTKINRNEELKDAYETAYATLKESFEEDSCDYDLISDFLKSWAESSGVEVEAQADHYTVLMNPASEGNSAKHTTVLQLSLDTEDIQPDLKTLSLGLASLLGPEEHDNIRLIVTEIQDGNFLGANDVSAKYLKCDDFINLSKSSNYCVFVSGSDTATATITEKAGRRAPKYSKAFEISMSFNKYADPFKFDKNNNYPDPIDTVGNLLATAKSAGRLFEIASFNSEANDGYMPYSVKTVIVIDENNIEGFKSRFDKSYSSIESRFDKIDSPFVYTMTETDLPETVFSDSATNGLISLMYTLNTGICEQDEDTGLIKAASYIKSVNTKKNIEVQVDMRARDSEILSTLISDYQTTSGLCNMKCSISDPYLVWTSSDDSNLANYFSSIVPLAENESNIMLAHNELDLFAAKNKKLNAISYCFVKDVSKNTLRNIVNYMDKSRSED